MKRPQHKQKERFKESVDKSLAAFQLNQDNWENCATDWLKWRKEIYGVTKHFVEKKCSHAKVKRVKRLFMDDDNTFLYVIVVAVSASLTNYMRSHTLRPLIDYTQRIPPHLYYSIRHKVYSNRCGLARYVNSYNINIQSKQRFLCRLCSIIFQF